MAVIAAAFGITIWRYETAQTQDRVALAALGTARTAGQLVIEFQDEQDAARRYLSSPSAAALRRVRLERAEFSRPLDVLRETPNNADNLAVAQAAAGEQHYYAVLTRLRGLAGTNAAAVARAGARLDAAAAQVLGPLQYRAAGREHARRSPLITRQGRLRSRPG